MKKTPSLLLLMLGLALLAGCSASFSDTGSAQLAVLLPRSDSSSISRVSVTASAADLPSASVDLASSHGLQGGNLGNLPAGANRSFLAEAFDAAGNRLFQGSASGVPISAGQSAFVAITLQALNAPQSSLNEPPVIDSLVASSTSVAVGGSISLQATAHGLHPEEPLTYAWSSSAGSFASDSEASTSWTAPSTPGAQTLTVTVTDSGGLSSSASVDLEVLSSDGHGSAQITVSFNSAPSVASLSVTASQLAVGQSTSVSASASDLDDDSLSYAWSASCAGSWANASSSAAEFTPSALPGGSCNNCDLTVTVSDGRGGQTTGTLALCVSTSAPPNRFPPRLLGSYSSAFPWELISAGQVLTYEVVATDPQGSALSFSWAANTGSLGTPASSASQSRTTWTAPTCASEGTTPAITATFTNAFSLRDSKRFEVIGLPTCVVSAWTATAAMGTARRDPTATLLSDGKVLVSGGQNTAALASAEVYTPASGTWRATGPLAAARYSHAAAPLPHGSVLVSGGYNSTNGYLAAAELYNPASNTWSATGPMLSPRYLHTATPLPDGKVLVTGGYNSASGYLATAEVYSPASGTWSATGAMSTLRGYHTATLLNNGKVLVAGGRGNSSSAFLATAELYDPATGTWSSTGAMSSPRASHTATLLPDGKVLISGGTNRSTYLATAELYDPATGTWSATGSMSTARASSAAGVMSNGKVLIAGGIRSTTYLSTAEAYNPSTGTWTSAGSMGSARGYHAVVALPNGKVLVAGGNTGSTPLATAELFTP
ncbi:Kelch repeat-containing protein [Hyalangium minutum]|uniref:High-affinity leucine-specific transport system, periplasmic binding protein LivK n=1 Tax=Hyalangium minutum TaxID=394096 RepID=A0A085WC97_9BACT|nr:kelch repeat-containing protein [Hyalangium minutum]KFE65310.1 High-affinity leucine-specific transport system, periplasmic binding protein LivK [Hyalangium minutum]